MPGTLVQPTSPTVLPLTLGTAAWLMEAVPPRALLRAGSKSGGCDPAVYKHHDRHTKILMPRNRQIQPRFGPEETFGKVLGEARKIPLLLRAELSLISHLEGSRRRKAASGKGILNFSNRSVDPAVLSCSKAHSKISSPIFPSVRFSRAAYTSNSARRACRTLRLSGAFHSPIEYPLTYAPQHGFTT